MHIPDGFLNTATVATTMVISAGGVGVAARMAGKEMEEKKIPLMGVLGAFVFAGQMLNFPIGIGTSGHLVGAALMSILLGPWSAALVMSLVIIIQCFIFQDGGLLALGANILNMSLIASFSSYFIYRLSGRAFGRLPHGNLIGVFLAAWSSVVLASAACALELGFSGVVPLGVALPAITGVHALIGIGEGLITAVVISFVRAVRPDLIKSRVEMVR